MIGHLSLFTGTLFWGLDLSQAAAGDGVRPDVPPDRGGLAGHYPLGAVLPGLAVLTEIVWRTQTTDTWVTFPRRSASMPLTFVYAALQYPLLMKHDASPEGRSEGGYRPIEVAAGRCARSPLAAAGHFAVGSRGRVERTGAFPGGEFVRVCSARELRRASLAAFGRLATEFVVAGSRAGSAAGSAAANLALDAGICLPELLARRHVRRPTQVLADAD